MPNENPKVSDGQLAEKFPAGERVPKEETGVHPRSRFSFEGENDELRKAADEFEAKIDEVVATYSVLLEARENFFEQWRRFSRTARHPSDVDLNERNYRRAHRLMAYENVFRNLPNKFEDYCRMEDKPEVTLSEYVWKCSYDF